MSPTGAQASLAFVPPSYSGDALMEAADGGLRLVCIITDGIPSQDDASKTILGKGIKKNGQWLWGKLCGNYFSGESNVGYYAWTYLQGLYRYRIKVWNTRV